MFWLSNIPHVGGNSAFSPLVINQLWRWLIRVSLTIVNSTNPTRRTRVTAGQSLTTFRSGVNWGHFISKKKLHVSKGLEEFIRQLKQRLGPPVYIGAFVWRMFSLTGMIPAMKQSEIRRRQKRERAILRGQVGLHQALYVTMFTKHCSLFRRPINRRFFSVPKWPV